VPKSSMATVTPMAVLSCLAPRGAALIRRLSTDVTFDSEQGCDPAESLEGDRRRRLMMHVVEVPPGVGRLVRGAKKTPRKEFFKLVKSDGSTPLTAEAVKRIGAFYPSTPSKRRSAAHRPLHDKNEQLLSWPSSGGGSSRPRLRQ
jgi:hypothetical protein